MRKTKLFPLSVRQAYQNRSVFRAYDGHEEKETDKGKALLALWEGSPVYLAVCPCHSVGRGRSLRASLSPGAAEDPGALPVHGGHFVSGLSGCFSARAMEGGSVAAAAGEALWLSLCR